MPRFRVGFPALATRCQWAAVPHGIPVVDMHNGWGDTGAVYCVAPTAVIAEQLVVLLNAASAVRDIQFIATHCLGS